MSLALIEESAKEVRRLAIAGSPLAVGDFRLKKLIPPLEQAGAKVPVFAQVAKAIGDLVNGKEAETASRLLGLSTLLNAILYTQGQTGAEGGLAELEVLQTKGLTTRTPARVLKPLVQALTASGAGRMELIHSACERGLFKDLRLIDPAIQALGDSYPEVADLAEKKILPGFGPGIVPRLRALFDPKGKRADARKLSVMHQLDPAGTLELCKTALEDGSPEVRSAAITCLGQHPECLPLVLEQANAKHKEVRGAALQVLAAHDVPAVTTLFSKLLQGKTLEGLAEPFRALRSPQVLKALFDEGQRVFGLLAKGDSDQIPRFGGILDCLQNRKDAEEFLLGCFAQCEKLNKVKAPKNHHASGADVVARMAALLRGLGTPGTLAALLDKRGVLPTQAFHDVFTSALRLWPADKVYTEFAPLLGQKKGAAKEMREDIERIFMHIHRVEFYGQDWDDEEDTETAELRKTTIDPRWLDAAVKAGEEEIVCCLARPGHKAAAEFLVANLEKSRMQADLFFRALARCQYPRITDTFLDLLARKTKGAKAVDYYYLYSLFECARHLPAADLPRLDAFAAKLDEKLVDKYLEALEPLRASKTPAA